MEFKRKAVEAPEYKFLYVEVPKSACGSVKNAIVEILGLEWRGKTHIDWRKGRIPEIDLRSERYRDYFKFTFVRNPFARLVSGYYSKFKTENMEYIPQVKARLGERKEKLGRILNPVKTRTGHGNVSFDDFVLYVRDSTDEELNRHWRPQHAFVTDQSGDLLVDFVGKVENMGADWRKVCEQIGVHVSMPHKNKTPHPPWQECYTAETWKIISKRYEKDIEIFGYQEVARFAP